MKLSLKASVVAISLALAAVTGCASPDAEDADATDQAVSVEGAPATVVRKYYAASRAADVAAALDGIVADDVVLEAPSVRILNPFGGTDEVRGKQAFAKAIAGGAFLLKNAIVAPVGAAANPESPVALSVMTPASAAKALVVSRIQLPLPNGDLLTQVEFFEVVNGKIVHIQSYYDATRFLAALPAIAVAKLKEAFAS